MKVQEDVDVLSFDFEEGQDISCPVHFVGDDFLHEGLDGFNCMLSCLIEDLGYVKDFLFDGFLN